MTIIKMDATSKILGKIAAEISQILRGKNKPDFNYNKVCGDKIIVYNINKIKVSGNKQTQKKYYSHSGYLGGIKETSYEEMFKKDPVRVLYLAVKGMLPKNRLQNKFLKNLTLLKGNLNDEK